MIRLVASDIDGTIIGENNQITSQNLKAIHDMTESQIDFTRKALLYGEKFLQRFAC